MGIKTKEQLSADLLIVDSAITTILEGKRVTKFTVGSGDFMRTYEMSEISYELLRDLRRDICDQLASLEPNVKRLRTGTIPLVVNKFGC